MPADLDKKLLEIMDEGDHEATEKLKIVLLHKEKTVYIDNYNSSLI